MASCSRCGGSGKISDDTATDIGYLPPPLIPCPNCSGTGTSNDYSSGNSPGNSSYDLDWKEYIPILLVFALLAANILVMFLFPKDQGKEIIYNFLIYSGTLILGFIVFSLTILPVSLIRIERFSAKITLSKKVLPFLKTLQIFLAVICIAWFLGVPIYKMMHNLSILSVIFWIIWIAPVTLFWTVSDLLNELRQQFDN